jgi:hypothetical protein
MKIEVASGLGGGGGRREAWREGQGIRAGQVQPYRILVKLLLQSHCVWAGDGGDHRHQSSGKGRREGIRAGPGTGTGAGTDRSDRSGGSVVGGRSGTDYGVRLLWLYSNEKSNHDSNPSRHVELYLCALG